MKHDPYITNGRKWSILPACSCGWYGRPVNDRGEAIRQSCAHAQRETRAEEAKR